MPFILQTNGLTKKIGSKTLVTDVNIHIPKGEIYGFLGPNGAGKTTVMKMITNLWKPTSGTIEVFGEVLTPKSYEVLKRMGSIIEFPTFYDHMTGRENLQLHCEYMGYYNVDSVESALQMLDLTAAADQPVKSYSLGMKERLGIARAIMCKPELLILDEPTNGLDPAGMKQIRDLLKTLCSEYGITVMISSHILSEVESIADTIGIIHRGKMMKEIRMQDIEEMNLNYVELSVTEPPEILYHGTAERFSASIEAKGLLPGNRLYVHLSPDTATAEKVGRRHGKPIIYLVNAGQMRQEGYTFLLSANGVWLTKIVPAQYLKRLGK